MSFFYRYAKLYKLYCPTKTCMLNIYIVFKINKYPCISSYTLNFVKLIILISHLFYKTLIFLINFNINEC